MQKTSRGFTLVEVLIVTVIIMVIAGLISFMINPNRIFSQARDNQRLQDLTKLSKALNQYGLDQNSFPPSTGDSQIQGAPFGSSWLPYFTKVPQDPLPTQTYAYVSNGKQFQLFAKLEREGKQNCTNCGPGNEYNYGLTSSTDAPPENLLTGAAPTATPSALPLPSGSPIPPSIRYQGEFMAFISSPDNPKMTKITLNPFDALLNEEQTVLIDVADTTSEVTAISLTLRTDNLVNVYPLTLSSGSASAGTWQGNWIAQDSHEAIYNLTLTATNANGQTSKVDIQLEKSLQNGREVQQNE